MRLSVLSGFGLAFVLLGGVAGGYTVLDRVSSVAAGSSVVMSLPAPAMLENAPERAPSRGAAVHIALAEITGLQVALPPVDALAASPAGPANGSETQRLLLDPTLTALSVATLKPQIPETGEEVLIARLSEEPLETAGGPIARDAAAPAATAIEQAPPPMPSLPNQDNGSQPAWQRFAVPVAAPGARPMIAVVLDDLGLNRAGTNRAIALPGPLTLAFMTYAEGLPRMTDRARRAGHELMLHVPMAPRDSANDPGPNVLRVELAPAELARRLDWGLDRFEGFVGVNNHMGSRFTASPEAMARVMAALQSRGLLFLDSVTSSASVGAAMARRAGVPFARRDVFLDNDWRDRAAIARQFALLEEVARRDGSAVGIGHPHRTTLDVLARWLPAARARGFAIVPVSAIVRHRGGPDAQYAETSG